MDSKITPILVELDEHSWEQQIERIRDWLDNLQMVQVTFLEMAEDASENVNEPHVREAIIQIAEKAKEHENKVIDLFEVIGRKPSRLRTTTGEFSAKVVESLTNFQGLMGGAVGAWNDIHRLFMANLTSMGAFAVTEQLGLAIANPDIVDITFPIVHEKQTHHLLLQEYTLELATISILYKSSF
jgi:rubrerythrin